MSRKYRVSGGLRVFLTPHLFLACSYFRWQKYDGVGFVWCIKPHDTYPCSLGKVGLVWDKLQKRQDWRETTSWTITRIWGSTIPFGTIFICFACKMWQKAIKRLNISDMISHFSNCSLICFSMMLSFFKLEACLIDMYLRVLYTKQNLPHRTFIT